MRESVQRARDAIAIGTEPYAALVDLLETRIDRHRDDLELAVDATSMNHIQGRIHEDRALLEILRPSRVRTGASPPLDY